MQANRSGSKVFLLGLVAVLLLSLPLAAAAQTTVGSSGAATVSVASTNGIASPKDMAALSGTVVVRGYANSPSFMKWQLDLLPNGDPNAAIFLTFGETPGEFTYSFDTTNLPEGEHALRLRVVRQDSNYDEYLTRFTIGKAAAAAAAAKTSATPAARSTTAAARGTTVAAAATSGVGVTTNGLAAPREGQAVSGNFIVRGYANDPNFMKWQLDLLPGGDQNSPIFLAFGETPGVFTYTLKTTDFPVGAHALRLRVVRSDSNYNEYVTKFVIGSATTAAKETAATESKETAATQKKEGETATTTTSAAVGVSVNGVSAPKEGETIRGEFVVKGYANDSNFMKWQLDLLPNGDATQAAFLAFGEKPGIFSYTLDTTSLPAGKHALRLRVVRNDSNYDEYVTNFTVTK